MKHKSKDFKKGANPIEMIALVAMLAVVGAYAAYWGYADSVGRAEHEAQNISLIHAFSSEERAEQITKTRNERTGCTSDVQTSRIRDAGVLRDVFVATQVKCPNIAGGGDVSFRRDDIISSSSATQAAVTCERGTRLC